MSSFTVSITPMKQCVASATARASALPSASVPLAAPPCSAVAGTPASSLRLAAGTLAPYVSKNRSRSGTESRSTLRSVLNLLVRSTHARSYAFASTLDRTYARSSFSSARASAYSVAKSSYRLRSSVVRHRRTHSPSATSRAGGMSAAPAPRGVAMSRRVASVVRIRPRT